jgi:hypothetical protein
VIVAVPAAARSPLTGHAVYAIITDRPATDQLLTPARGLGTGTSVLPERLTAMSAARWPCAWHPVLPHAPDLGSRPGVVAALHLYASGADWPPVRVIAAPDRDQHGRQGEFRTARPDVESGSGHS